MEQRRDSACEGGADSHDGSVARRRYARADPRFHLPFLKLARVQMLAGAPSAVRMHAYQNAYHMTELSAQMAVKAKVVRRAQEGNDEVGCVVCWRTTEEYERLHGVFEELMRVKGEAARGVRNVTPWTQVSEEGDYMLRIHVAKGVPMVLSSEDVVASTDEARQKSYQHGAGDENGVAMIEDLQPGMLVDCVFTMHNVGVQEEEERASEKAWGSAWILHAGHILHYGQRAIGIQAKTRPRLLLGTWSAADGPSQLLDVLEERFTTLEAERRPSRSVEASGGSEPEPRGDIGDEQR
ncbi:hypothetical protein HMN09_00453700 [Mycena chlorophos]|uniref:Uncharacterized protein n=1 Tax=Mycena chlorophos TaxID=658473 RepID=A0A8H6TEK6_MYCCL|nr:hypothetical protein HMN09_00453700 [Mycena chlorophos]